MALPLNRIELDGVHYSEVILMRLLKDMTSGMWLTLRISIQPEKMQKFLSTWWKFGRVRNLEHHIWMVWCSGMAQDSECRFWWKFEWTCKEFLFTSKEIRSSELYKLSCLGTREITYNSIGVTGILSRHPYAQLSMAAFDTRGASALVV